MYKEVLEENQVTQTPEFTLSILTYEVGKLHQLRIYKERFGKTGFIGDEKAELGDVITMAKLYAEQRGLDPAKLEVEGLERFRTRIAEVRQKQLEERYGDAPEKR